MKTDTEAVAAGARNLLLNCAGVVPGDRVLLVGEAGDAPWFEPALCEAVAREARLLGAGARIVMAAPVAGADAFPAEVADAMQDVERTIFFSRLGDQVRFLETPGPSRKIMCYTITLAHLASPFATVDHRAMLRIHDAILAAIEGAREYTIRGDCGTRLRAEFGDGENTAILSEFSVELFPVMIFPPVNFHRLAGRLVLQRFLTSTSTRAYAGSVLRLDSPVSVQVEDCRMVGFEGDRREIDAVRRQLERAAAITGGDPYRFNSWHTGLNAHTFFAGDPYADLEYWGTVAYGSPRYTHIHAAGHDPGDLCVHLFDASIRFDDRLLWDEGRLLLLDSLEPAEAKRFPAGFPDSSTRAEIGI